WNGPWGVFVQPYYLYGDIKLGEAQPRMKTDDERYLRAVVFHTFSRPLFELGLLVVDHNLRRRIARRALGGVGVGATLVHRSTATVMTSFGLLGENTHYDAAPASVRNVARLTARVYGRYKLAGGHVALIHDLYVMPNVRDTSEWRALFSGAFEV